MLYERILRKTQIGIWMIKISVDKGYIGNRYWVFLDFNENIDHEYADGQALIGWSYNRDDAISWASKVTEAQALKRIKVGEALKVELPRAMEPVIDKGANVK